MSSSRSTKSKSQTHKHLTQVVPIRRIHKTQIHTITTNQYTEHYNLYVLIHHTLPNLRHKMLENFHKHWYYHLHNIRDKNKAMKKYYNKTWTEIVSPIIFSAAMYDTFKNSSWKCYDDWDTAFTFPINPITPHIFYTRNIQRCKVSSDLITLKKLQLLTHVLLPHNMPNYNVYKIFLSNLAMDVVSYIQKLIDNNNIPNAGIQRVTCVSRGGSTDHKDCNKTPIQVVTVVNMSNVQIGIGYHTTTEPLRYSLPNTLCNITTSTRRTSTCNNTPDSELKTISPKVSIRTNVLEDTYSKEDNTCTRHSSIITRLELALHEHKQEHIKTREEIDIIKGQLDNTKTELDKQIEIVKNLTEELVRRDARDSTGVPTTVGSHPISPMSKSSSLSLSSLYPSTPASSNASIHSIILDKQVIDNRSPLVSSSSSDTAAPRRPPKRKTRSNGGVHGSNQKVLDVLASFLSSSGSSPSDVSDLRVPSTLVLGAGASDTMVTSPLLLPPPYPAEVTLPLEL